MMKTFYLSVIFISISSFLFGQAEWEQISPLPNDLVTDHSYAFALNGKGYFVAGADRFSYLDDFFEYDPETDEWTRIGEFPGGVRGFGIGDTWDGKAYFGFGFNGNNYQDDLWVFDPETETWTELAPCPCTPRIHPAFIAHNDKIFVGLGGSAQGDLNDWWEYDMATDSWSQKPDFPDLPRHHPYQFGVGDYVYTGFGHGGPLIFDEWYRYDPATEEWTQMATLPAEGRVAGTQFSFNGKGYALSGDGGDHRSMEEGEFWAYDPELDEWEELPPHPGPSRWAPASFVLDGWVYFLSGPTNVGGNLNYTANNSYRYQLEEMPTSTQELTDDPGLFEVFPNPTAEQVQFSWKSGFAGTAGQFRILNNEGRTVYQTAQLPEELDLSFLPAGLYHLEAVKGQTRSVKTVVKE